MKTIERMIPYACPFLDEADIDSVVQALKGDSLTRGPIVEKFESAIATYCGAAFAVCFNSGTTALHAAYYAFETNPNDLVISTPNTFVGSIIGALHYGAQLKFVDIDPKSGNLSIDLLNEEIDSHPGRKIICPVHFSGNPVDISAILQKNTLILEDAAHAFGASDLQGKKIGGCHFSEMTIFSFHPAKSITTGEGGAVVTNRQDLYRRLCEFRNNGIVRGLPNSEYPGYYDVAQITGNYNFTDFQAALGLSQLSKLDFFIEKRRKLVRVYREILGNTPFVTLFDPSLDPFSAHHLMVVQIAFDHFEKSRANVMEELKKRGIGTQVHYRSLDRHTAIDKRKTLSPLPKMELYYREALTLPLYYELTEEDVAMICDQLFETLGIR